MKHFKSINEFEVPRTADEEVQDALMTIFTKGLGINPEEVTAVDSKDKFMIVRTSKDAYRIDMTMRHHFDDK